MAELSIRAWGLIAVVVGVGVLSLLGTIASSIRGFRHLHDLKARVVLLRLQYLASLKQVNALRDPNEIPQTLPELVSFLLEPTLATPEPDSPESRSAPEPPVVARKAA